MCSPIIGVGGVAMPALAQSSMNVNDFDDLTFFNEPRLALCEM